ncbi:hypothetical protein LCGC14_1252800 [marine sediment metagenome]|uniref:Uncharacterized protein n=1 Tax=marine sediment metagenome TaxID=412755 RepID=A0A0F9LP82_9ZZZZ
MTRKDIYKLIDEEREYQKNTWENSGSLPTTGEITLLRFYLRKFEDHYQAEDDAPNGDCPEECLHDIRKMATILIRCMENHSVLPRK